MSHQEDQEVVAEAHNSVAYRILATAVALGSVDLGSVESMIVGDVTAVDAANDSIDPG